LVVNGEAEIILDKTKIEELWTPVAKIWFKEGKDDPTISVIKVKPTTAYYWDRDGDRMINLLKIATSVVTGTNLITGKEGTIKI
jgi:general stress protein 26